MNKRYFSDFFKGIKTSNDKEMFKAIAKTLSYSRDEDDEKITVVINFSDLDFLEDLNIPENPEKSWVNKYVQNVLILTNFKLVHNIIDNFNANHIDGYINSEEDEQKGLVSITLTISNHQKLYENIFESIYLYMHWGYSYSADYIYKNSFKYKCFDEYGGVKNIHKDLVALYKLLRDFYVSADIIRDEMIKLLETSPTEFALNSIYKSFNEKFKNDLRLLSPDYGVTELSISKENDEYFIDISNIKLDAYKEYIYNQCEKYKAKDIRVSYIKDIKVY